MSELFGCVWKGALIGLANIIPGVSGGTLALILGVYKRLIDSISAIDGGTIKVFLLVLVGPKKALPAIKEELRRIDFLFLFVIFGGALAAIVAVSRLMEYVLTHHHAASYGFFFGLILVSVYFPFTYLTRKSWKEWVSGLLAVVCTISLTMSVSPAEKVEKEASSQARHAAELVGGVVSADQAATGFVSMRVLPLKELAWLFFAAACAISAMILPGISGSFILLLLGVYFQVLGAITNREVVTLAVFALGMGGGLLVFVRLMKAALNKVYNPTIAFMVGLMVGSLYSIWPFQRFEMVGEVAVYTSPELPAGFSGDVLLACVTILVGAGLIGLFIRLDRQLGGERTLL